MNRDYYIMNAGKGWKRRSKNGDARIVGQIDRVRLGRAGNVSERIVTGNLLVSAHRIYGLH